MRDFFPNLGFFLIIGFTVAFMGYPFLLAATWVFDWIAGEHLYRVPFNPRLLAASGLVWMAGFLAGGQI